MDIKKIQELVGKEKEVIICTTDGRIKKVRGEKDKWIHFALSNKMENKEKAIIVGEDYQVTGRVVGFGENGVLIECVGFFGLVFVKLSKITSIY